MKRLAFGLIALMLAFSFVLTSAPQSAQAVGSDAWVLPLADASTTFSTVNVDEAAKTAPAWLQQFSEGVVITKATKICYPFRSGQFSWVPQILELKDGLWSRVITTKEYLSGPEGSLFACATPSNAGTFALFAYYTGPIEPPIKEKKTFTVGSWDIGFRTSTQYLEITSLVAKDVNWQGYYPSAKKLGWGIRMCWDEDCHEFIDKSIDISSSTYPYPQHFDAPIVEKYSIGIFPPGPGHTCEFKPFVKLLDAKGNVLEVIYYTDYATYCVS